MRVNAYIDGYSLYHAEVNLNDNRLKWVNLRALCQHFCDEGDILDKVYYFTALAEYYKFDFKKSYKLGVHNIYMDEFLSGFGVEKRLGNFKKTKIGECSKCKKILYGHKEKQTDINLALQVYDDAIENKFDKAFLVTADTDFASVITKIKENIKTHNKKIVILAPHKCNKKNFGGVDRIYKLKKEHFAGHLLPKYGKNGAMMPIYNLLTTQSEKQNKLQIDNATRCSKNIQSPPKEFPPCEKCKAYLSYESYEKISKKINV